MADSIPVEHFNTFPHFELARKVLDIAQNALTSGGTWSEADRMDVLTSGLEEIEALCKETLKG